MTRCNQDQFDAAFRLRYNVGMFCMLSGVTFGAPTVMLMVATLDVRIGANVWLAGAAAACGGLFFCGAMIVLWNFFYDISCNPRWKKTREF